MESVYASSGSACRAGSQDPSHVLLAIGRRPALAHTARRLILGAPTIETEVERVLDLLPAWWIECATRPPLSGSQLNDEHVSCFGLDRLTVKP